jgi:hypothetical protein
MEAIHEAMSRQFTAAQQSPLGVAFVAAHAIFTDPVDRDVPFQDVKEYESQSRHVHDLFKGHMDLRCQVEGLGQQVKEGDRDQYACRKSGKTPEIATVSCRQETAR